MGRCFMSMLLLDDKEGLERIAQALLISNDDPMYRAGVIVLAHALGADKVRLSSSAFCLTQLANSRHEVIR